MNSEELSKYIAEVEISDAPESGGQPMSLGAAQFDSDLNSPELLKPSAAVAGGAIVIFADGVSALHRQDVTNCMLMAELVANKKGNREEQQKKWYEDYDEVLLNFGWAGARLKVNRDESVSQTVSMDKVGLELIIAAISAMTLPGPTAALLVKVAGEAVAKLKDEERALKIFDRHARNKGGADFQVVVAVEDSGGQLYLALAAVSFKASVDVVSVLFWGYNSSSVEVYQASSVRVLSESTMKGVREEIAVKLQNHAAQSIANYEI